MSNNFENLRAERDIEHYRAKPSPNYAGLWKQIALGIVVGYTVLSLLGFVATMLWLKLAASGLQLQVPS
ncbi:hypothetical protein [Pseudomonas sp. M30-35]|uniref:hypothetical protein n=1 Tax=Pseudomonas sp. M30-35 TaxID=1981174 RepID=UPI000B3D0151|nr:hypothetical protein [Pseudomonas sp. M30-35]ARU87457.1 hypothetical protein B9K09_05490 [Pseudomonas sp. M30-35]